MATGDILQIVVFSIVFAIGLGMVGEKARPMIEWCESLTEAMFKVTNIVMLYAPIGVGAAIAYTIGVSGLQVLQNLAFMIVTLYVALAAFFLLVLIPVMLMFRIPIVAFFKAIKEPALIAFSTTSSEAALPRAMECVEAFGVPRRIVSFILPLGYSFNLDGTTLYLSLASIFIAQAGGIELSWGQQLTMMLTLMLTSKGVAGVPRAALVILAATVASFNLPLAGVALVLGVDALMDMGRTMTNVIGNCLAAVVVAKWEGEFTAFADGDGGHGLSPQIQEKRNQQRVGEVDEERADERHHQERFRRRPVALDERAHVGHGVGRRAQHEAAEAARHHRRVVVAAHQPRHHQQADRRDQRDLRRQDDQQRNHQAGQLPQPQRHQRHHQEQRQRDVADVVDHLLRQAEHAGDIVELRNTAATSIAPM